MGGGGAGRVSTQRAAARAPYESSSRAPSLIEGWTRRKFASGVQARTFRRENTSPRLYTVPPHSLFVIRMRIFSNGNPAMTQISNLGDLPATAGDTACLELDPQLGPRSRRALLEAARIEALDSPRQRPWRDRVQGRHQQTTVHPFYARFARLRTRKSSEKGKNQKKRVITPTT